jgi:predicted esterase
MNCEVMPRGRMSKVDMLSRVYKMKTALYNGQHADKSGEWHEGAHEALNKVLDALNEYSS